MPVSSPPLRFPQAPSSPLPTAQRPQYHSAVSGRDLPQMLPGRCLAVARWVCGSARNPHGGRAVVPEFAAGHVCARSVCVGSILSPQTGARGDSAASWTVRSWSQLRSRSPVMQVPGRQVPGGKAQLRPGNGPSAAAPAPVNTRACRRRRRGPLRTHSDGLTPLDPKVVSWVWKTATASGPGAEVWRMGTVEGRKVSLHLAGRVPGKTLPIPETLASLPRVVVGSFTGLSRVGSGHSEEGWSPLPQPLRPPEPLAGRHCGSGAVGGGPEGGWGLRRPSPEGPGDG